MTNRTLQKQITSGEKSLNNRTGNGKVQPIPEVYAFDIQSREFIASKPNCPSNKRKGIRTPSRHRQLSQRILDIAMLPSTPYSPDTIHNTQQIHNQCRGQGRRGGYTKRFPFEVSVRGNIASSKSNDIRRKQHQHKQCNQQNRQRRPFHPARHCAW